MKKFITIILIAIMALSLSACGVDNTPDYNANKENQDTQTENTINLDDCYVCHIYFNDTEHWNGSISLGDGVFAYNMTKIKGYYIYDNVIKEYELATIQYLGGWYERDKNYEIEFTNRLVSEYHGITNYSLTVALIEYQNELRDVWTWGELKQLILLYNLTHGE